MLGMINVNRPKRNTFQYATKSFSVMERISFSDGGTPDERLIDFDPENLSSTGHFFQNALDDVLEEYGDTLETSEKIGILMNLVRKLMG